MLLTNASAQVALRTLKTANASLQQSQNRISTGLKVANAGDNAAFFLVSTTQRSDRAVIDGTRENLNYALGAVKTALSAQSEIDNAILNIKQAVVALENGVATEELDKTIAQQVDNVREVLRSASFNGVNLLERDQTETFIIGVERDRGSFDFQTLNVQAQGLGIRTPPVSATVPPYPGFVLDLNSTVLTGSAGNLAPRAVGSVAGVNVGTNGTGGISQRTFGISFETGADVTRQQVLYEEGGGIRGLNISIRNGLLVFGGYNNVPSDPTAPWAYREVQVSIEANTRYTAQLVLDGNTSNTGEFRAYLNGEFVDRQTGVGILYDHGDPIGVGRINGSAVVNGAITSRIAGPTGNDFEGDVDKVIIYNQVFTAGAFDEVNGYLAEGWLPTGGLQFYIGSPARQESATLIELLEAVNPVDQAGFSVSAALEVLETAQAKANRAFSQLGFYESRLSRQSTYLFGLSDSIEEGVAALVEADLAEESAKLQAFQVQTQLATQSLLIANRRPQTLLQLFN